MSIRWTAVMAAGWVVLFARPLATTAGWAVIVAVGVLGIIAPAGQNASGAGRVWWIGAVAVGVAAFTAARMIATHTLVPATVVALLATMIAAASEEAFFRRLVYGWFARWGDGVAVVAAAAAFAVVHLRGYGLWSLPVNLAAGLLFGWQRWATGRWSSAAVTHAIANLLQTL